MNAFSWYRVVVMVTGISLLVQCDCVAGADDPAFDEARRLVEQLASPNKEFPLRQDPWGNKFPKDYDKSAQETVVKSCRRLQELGISAFPALFEHFDDKRYALTNTNTANGVWQHRYVRQICHDIVKFQIEPYAAGPQFNKLERPAHVRNAPTRPSYTDEFLTGDESRKKSWQSHKDKSLHDVQLEAIEWVIAAEAKSKEEFSARETEFLNSLAKRLRESNQPLKARGGACWGFNFAK